MMASLPTRPALRLAVNRRIVDSPLGTRYLASKATMRRLLPGAGTEIYVDGFPRSANSYAFYAIKQSNPGARLAGHCHSADAIGAALDLKVPVMLLLREPAGCAASFIRYVPGLKPAAALRHYARFHRRVAQLKDDLFVAEFSQVTTEFGAVMDTFNSFAGTDFSPYRKTLENEAEVNEMLDHANERYAGGSSHTLARPTAGRASVPKIGLTRRERSVLDECAELYEWIRS